MKLRFRRRVRTRSSVADQMALHQHDSLMALSRFHPQLSPSAAPMDHGYAVDVAHLLFTAECGFARYATPAPWNWAASAQRTMGFARDLRGETIVECTPV